MKKCHFCLVLAGTISAMPVFAVENVTAINTTISSGTPSTANGYTFENSVQSVTSFSTATANYIVASLADNVFVRRNGTSANNSSVWYATSGTGNNLSGVDQTAYDRLLLNNNVYFGSDNTFSNDAGPAGGNVERLISPGTQPALPAAPFALESSIAAWRLRMMHFPSQRLRRSMLPEIRLPTGRCSLFPKAGAEMPTRLATKITVSSATVTATISRLPLPVTKRISRELAAS